MNAATLAIIAGLGVTALITLVTLLKVLRFSSSSSRNLTVALLVTILISISIYLLPESDAREPHIILGRALSHLFPILGAAFLLHLVLSFRRPQKTRAGWPLIAGLYMPALFILAAWSLTIFTSPRSIHLEWDSGLLHVEFGSLAPLLAIVESVYALGIIFTLVQLLRKEGELRRELLLTLFFVALRLASIPMWIWHPPGFPPCGASLLLMSLIGVALAYAVMKKSPLIVPMSEERTVERPIDILKPGATYLYLGEKEQARELFVKYIKTGKEGLWITRRPPREAREEYGLHKTPFIWLTGVMCEGETCIDPYEFGPLSTAISRFTREAKNYIILIEGMEYIMTKTGFPTVLKLVNYLNDRVMSTGGILMLGLNPSALESRDLAMLKSEAAAVFEETEISSGTQNKGPPSPDAGAA